MAESTTSRVLRLLSLLQTHRFWVGADLAERLGVSGRTLRRDVERLRELGYNVGADRGPDGGYRLDASEEVPPIALSNQETVAVAVALGMASTATPIAGLAEASVTALAKLEQVVPVALRGTVRAFRAAMVAPGSPGEALVDPELLAQLALAVRDHQRVLIRYVDRAGAETQRRVEPHALVPLNKRWYAVCWDLGATDWRSFRIDRVARIDDLRIPFAPRPLPLGDPTEWVTRRQPTDAGFRAVVRIDAPYDVVTAYLGGYARDLSPEGDAQTIWLIHADQVEALAGAVIWLPWAFQIEGSNELITHLEGLSARWANARSGIVAQLGD